MLIVVIVVAAAKATVVVAIAISLTADCLIKLYALAHRYFCDPFDFAYL